MHDKRCSVKLENAGTPRSLSPMKLRCAALGHRWRQVDDDVDAPFAVLRCRRCDKVWKLAPGTELLERLTARERRRGPELGLNATRFRR